MPEFHLPSKGTQWAPPKRTTDYILLVIWVIVPVTVGDSLSCFYLIVHGIVQGAGLTIMSVLILLTEILEVPGRPL